MIYNANTLSLCLTLVWEKGGLLASLSDSRAIGCLGRTTLSAQRLHELGKWSATLLRQPTLRLENAEPDSPESPANSVLALGKYLFSKLLPANIQQCLADAAPSTLHLQVSETLMALPWEAAFDGVHFLGGKFWVVRHMLINQVPNPEPPRLALTEDIKVLIIHSDDELHLDSLYARELCNSLEKSEGISVKSLAWDVLTRQQTLRWIRESDIVHCVGMLPVIAVWPLYGLPNLGEPALTLLEVVQATTPAQLLVFEKTQSTAPSGNTLDPQPTLIGEVSRRGLRALFRVALLAGDDRPDFMAAFYKALVNGHTLPQALHEAATDAVVVNTDAARGASCLETQLYGDPTALRVNMARGQQEDNNHRQVTILSYDLVDSTKLLSTLGAEKYSDVLDDFHGCCARIVEKWGGSPNDPQGSDGIMCYFGLPVAQEDAAAQALRAATEIIHAVTALSEPGLVRVRVRIGIVTGSVVVKAGLPVGVSIHLAARLQSIAEPDTVVVSETTRQIVKNRFDFLRLDNVPPLKGINRPGMAYRLVGENQGAALASVLRQTPFVGRESEMAWLAHRWDTASKGHITVVGLQGEAGIGKSRLVNEFKQFLAPVPHLTLECRCTPDHTNSAFHPVIELLQRRFKIHDNTPQPEKLAKLTQELAQLSEIGMTTAEAVNLLAPLLALPLPSPANVQISAERQRQSTIDVLVAWVKHQACTAPLCWIVEDVHWLDPSSRALLRQVVNTSATLPLLLVLTQRTDEAPPHHADLNVQTLELQALAPDAAEAMVLEACVGANVPPEAIRLLTEKADGIPLFIEESARMLFELHADHSSLDKGSLDMLKAGVPSTIQDLLMARLDRLAGAKQIAQLGGAIGRDFSLALMQAVLAHETSPIKAEKLESRLETLVRSGILVEKGGEKGIRYYFRHALLRDAAYQSLWERDRRKIHHAIAVVVSECFPVVADSQPEILAHHYTAAGLSVQAVTQWERATRLAISRSAHEEAINHVNHGLALITAIPLHADRNTTELRLQLLLAGQLIGTEGYGADHVGKVYQRADVLGRACGDQRALLKIQFGLEGYHLMRGDFHQAHAFAAQATELARQSPDPMSRVQANWAVAHIFFHQGDLTVAVQQMDACFADYQLLEHRPNAVQDAGVMCLCYSALAKWLLGDAQDALRRAQLAITLAEQMQHKFSQGEAYGFCAMVHYFRGEFLQARDCAEHAIAICDEGGFTVWLAHAKLIHGRSIADLGDADAGIAEMREGFTMWATSGAVVTRAFYLAIQAEGYALAGCPDEGLALLQTAFDLVSRYGERYYEPEIRRLYGHLLLQSAALHGQNRDVEAERWFSSALASAYEHHMSALTLRATTSLCQLWLVHGRIQEATEALMPLFSDATEAPMTNDMALAWQLWTSLKELQRVSKGNSDDQAESLSTSPGPQPT